MRGQLQALLLSSLFGLGCSESADAPEPNPGAGSGGGGQSSGGMTGTAGTSGSTSGGSTSAGGGQSSGGSSAVDAPPCGIFLGGAVRAETYVSGILVTTFWDQIELGAGSYEFGGIDGWLDDLPEGQRFALRLLGNEPAHVVAAATSTWTFVDPIMGRDCSAPGCTRPSPWDPQALSAYEAMVAAYAQASVTAGGVTAPLAEHPALESIMLMLPGWSRIRELNFEVETIPGYERALLIEGTRRALAAQASNFPGTPVFVQFFLVDDGAEPPLWEELRDAILADPELDSVGFYQENLAHSVDSGTDTFRPATEIAAPLFSAKDQTFTGFQALTSWAEPFANMADRVAGGSPAAAMDWALETYGSRYFELYVEDIDAANGAHPEWKAAYEELAAKLCSP